eukprot:gb/GECH01010388.1/.p1 GENE.gb/GECH01010388.1/~~gb/GECH01010388.1/.p1  ORF type:complete len:1102 (+),score=183.20 gb/GECH01010388.1/:1-3306(+)
MGGELSKQFFQRNTQNGVVDLSCHPKSSVCPIGGRGSECLSKYIEHNNSLRGINVIKNNIGDEGAKHIENGIQNNDSIETLHLEDPAIQHLSNVGVKNSAVPILDFGGNQIGKENIKGIESLLENNRKMKKYGYSKIQRGKLLVLGDGGVGKTCLIRSLNRLPFRQQTSTQVLSMQTITFNSKEHEEKLEVSVTDFGGQNVYRSFHSLIMDNNCVYMLVFRAKDFETRLDPWLDTLKTLTDLENNRVVVVLTHCDGFSPAVRRYEGVDQFFKVDNKTKEGITQLRNGLYNQFHSESVNRIKFSNNHAQVIEKIREHRPKLEISLEQFRQWARGSGFRDENSIRSLLRTLQETNIVFHFNKIKDIKDLIWITPDRLIKLLRSILNADSDRSHSQHFDRGLLKKCNIENAFKHVVQYQNDKKDESDIISGLLDILWDINMIFPVKSKNPPFNVEGFIVPSELPDRKGDVAGDFHRESLKAEKLMVRSIKIPKLFLSGIFGRLMAMLWKHIFNNSYSGSFFYLKYNNTKAIIDIRLIPDNILIVVFGKYPLKLLSLIYSSMMEIMKQMAMSNKNIEDSVKAVCPKCYRHQREDLGTWKKSAVYSLFLQGIKTALCNCCAKHSNIVDLLFDETTLYVAYNYARLLDNNLLSIMDHVNSAVNETDIGGELYPVHDSTTRQDQKQILQSEGKMNMDNWDFLERLGKSRHRGHYGGGSAVYLCKCKIHNLANPDRLYAVKVKYNMYETKRKDFCHDPEYSMTQKIETRRTFVNQVCSFSDQLNTKILPDWDAEGVKDGTWSLFFVSDAYDGILKHRWPRHSYEAIFNAILQIFYCLQDLQDQRIAHRDIKADNFFYSSEYDCFLLGDFGEAIQLHSEDMQYSIADGMLLWGCPATQPPEVKPGQTIDYSKADLFGTGIMLLSLISNLKESSLINRFNSNSDDQHAQVIDEIVGTETKEQQFLGNLIYQILRETVEYRFTVQNAIDAVSYQLWGQHANENMLEQWKKDRIHHIGFEQLNMRKMKMKDILEMEYVSSLTVDKIRQGRRIGQILEQRSNIQQKPVECGDCQYDPPLSATKYCHDENTYFCHECYSMKHKGPKSRKHRITAV